jgi:hypothetical protein
MRSSIVSTAVLLLLAAPAGARADDPPSPVIPVPPAEPPPVEQPVAVPAAPAVPGCVISDDQLSSRLPLSAPSGAVFAEVEGPIAVRLGLPIDGPPSLHLELSTLVLDGGTELDRVRAYAPHPLAFDAVARIRQGTMLLLSDAQERDLLLAPEATPGYVPEAGKRLAVRSPCGEVVLQDPGPSKLHPPAAARRIWVSVGTAIAPAPGSPPTGKITAYQEAWLLGKKKHFAHVLVRTAALDLDGWVPEQTVGMPGRSFTPALKAGPPAASESVGERQCQADMVLQIVPPAGAPEAVGTLKQGAQVFSSGRQGGLTLVAIKDTPGIIHLEGGASFALATADYEENCSR